MIGLPIPEVTGGEYSLTGGILSKTFLIGGTFTLPIFTLPIFTPLILILLVSIRGILISH